MWSNGQCIVNVLFIGIGIGVLVFLAKLSRTLNLLYKLYKDTTAPLTPYPPFAKDK